MEQLTDWIPWYFHAVCVLRIASTKAHVTHIAISTVLNNPHKRQAPPKAHSLLPPVPVADLPRVRRKDFDSYLKAITPEWSRYEHNTKLGQEGQAEIEDTQWTPRNSIAGEDPHTPTRTASQVHTQGKLIPPLDSVPAIFFEKQFNLSDPHTFATVTEQDAAAAMATPQDSSFADPFSLSHSLPLLEKFDHYSDTVEQHLVREISIRSTSFFAALTNLHDLQAESERCLSRIGKLRTQLNEVDNNSAKRGLEMVRRGVQNGEPRKNTEWREDDQQRGGDDRGGEGPGERWPVGRGAGG